MEMDDNEKRRKARVLAGTLQSEGGQMIIETIRQAIDNWFHSLVDRRRTSQSIDRLAGGICFGEQILSSLNLDVDMGRRIANRAEKGTGLLAGQSRLEHSREQSRPPVVKDGI